MATTTNYGWTTPNDTDLVKDGAAAIRTLGSSIDTTTKALNPSTTLGDVEYRSATANTNTRLAIGTTGQVLTVTGGVPAWSTISAGGMTLLSTTSLSGATTTISSINQTYNRLVAYVFGVTNATAHGVFRIAPNGSTNISARGGQQASGTVNTNQDTYITFTGSSMRTERSIADNAWTVTIDNYASTTAKKSWSIFGGYYAQEIGEYAGSFQHGYVNSNTAISSLVFSNGGGDLSTGTVLLYGVK
jgi:hypothetical protein